MDRTVTYSDFTGYDFELSADEFSANLLDAQAVVDWIVGINVVDDSNIDAYKRAVCAAVVKVAAYGIDPSPNFSIGSFSIGATEGETDGRAMAQAAALPYLIPAGLAYMGLL